MSIAFTPLMKKRLTHRAFEMIERSLRHFPELHGKTITVGLTRKHLGSASIGYRAGDYFASNHSAQGAQGKLSNHRPRIDTSRSGFGPW